MTNEEKDKKEYELAVLVKNEADVATVLTLINQHHGESTSEPRAKHLNFAYEVKKQNEGVFARFTFKAYGDDIKNLEGDLRTRQDVLRFLVIASPAPAEQIPSPMADRRPSKPVRPVSSPETRPAPRPLSNEALEKKIEEILQ